MGRFCRETVERSTTAIRLGVNVRSRGFVEKRLGIIFSAVVETDWRISPVDTPRFRVRTLN